VREAQGSRHEEDRSRMKDGRRNKFHVSSSRVYQKNTPVQRKQTVSSSVGSIIELGLLLYAYPLRCNYAVSRHSFFSNVSRHSLPLRVARYTLLEKCSFVRVGNSYLYRVSK
jgi:hypothetical protein